MMSSQDFYVTLLSDSSKIYFPDNTSTHFCTQLAKSIHLDGEWCVGLTEIQYPCSFLTVQEGENVICCTYNVNFKNALTRDILTGYLEDEHTSNWFREQMKHHQYDSVDEILNRENNEFFPVDVLQHKTKIDAGNYETVDEILEALNQNVVLNKNNVKFTVDQKTRKIHVACSSQDMISLTLSSKLCLQLGFVPDVNILNKMSTHPANILLGLPSLFFIYTDIIEPQLIGDVLAKVLRVTVLDNAQYIYGVQRVRFFSQPHYVPVLKREFENIEIDIRSNTGEKIPFEFGTVSVKLHFKKLS